MKICVVGAGSIGGLLGVKLALAGEQVSLIARGPHLQAIKTNGLKLIMEDGSEHVAKDIPATDNMRELGQQDLVILGVKSHQIAPVIEDIRSLFGPDTIVMTTQNGVPWWYFQKLNGEYEGTVVRTVDPDGTLAKGIEPERIIGSIPYPAAEISAPGVIRHVEGIRFPLGELDGSESARAQRLSELLIRAGFKAPLLTDLRSEIWLKLWGNLTFNPISALCHATLEDICVFPLSRELAAEMMRESQIIGEKLGAHFRVDIERRIKGAERVGKHKTSMLQDVEAGKAMEIESIIGAVVELGKLTDTPTPAISAVYACISLLDKMIQEQGIRLQGQPK